MFLSSSYKHLFLRSKSKTPVEVAFFCFENLNRRLLKKTLKQRKCCLTLTLSLKLKYLWAMIKKMLKVKNEDELQEQLKQIKNTKFFWAATKKNN